MRKNETRFKTLDVVNNDPRIAKVFQDPDGIWLWLNHGFTCEPRGAHDGHENTVREILNVYRGIVPCDCAECVKHAPAPAPVAL